MTLSERLAENVRACFAGIWVQSYEHEDALQEIARLCHAQQWRLATWDIDQGMRIAGQTGLESSVEDPLAAVRALGTLAVHRQPTLLVLVNFHRFLNSAGIVQAVATQIVQGKTNATSSLYCLPLCRFQPNSINCSSASNTAFPAVSN